MRPLENKVAVVTGGSRGIGRAIALALASRGADVVVCSRSEEHLEAVGKEIADRGTKSLIVRADVSREADVKNLASAALKRFGTVHILVNNAGIGAFAHVAEMATADFDAMWSVNMRGVFLCTREFLPLMVKQEEGDIINIASLAGRNAFVGGAGYCATKWALVGFARCLMLEVRSHNVRVITLCPGSVDTDFGDRAAGAPKSQGVIPNASDIAQVAVESLLMPRHVMVSEIDIRPTNPKG